MDDKINKRELQAQKTKKLFLDIATNLFKEKGYYKVTIDDITEKAGLSVGAFYHHFKSKDDLIILWADDIDAKYDNFYLKLKKNNKANNLEKIKSMIFYTIEVFSSWGSEFAGVSYSYMMKEPRAAKRMLDPQRGYFKAMNEFIKKGKLEGCIRNDIEDEELLKDIVMVTRGAILDWCINGGTEDIIKRSTTFICSYIEGISAKDIL